MAYICDICGKGKQFGHNVSFSQRKTQKVWKPNLQRKYISLGDSRIQIKVSTQCLRTLAKYDRSQAAAPAPAETTEAAPEKPVVAEPAAAK
jgi:large subunit ribosomal protein L28